MQLFKIFRNVSSSITLLQKLYFGFGAILIVFSFVTFTYVQQSDNVKENLESVNRAVEILRLAQGLEKDAIDSQTGVRGYQVTEDSTFLAPYYKGKREFKIKLHKLSTLVQDENQARLLIQADSTYEFWLSSFAEPSIKLQTAALTSPEHLPAYTAFFKSSIKTGKGKNIMDSFRSKLDRFDEIEIQIRNNRLKELHDSISFNNTLAISLTLLCLIAGILIAATVGNIIKSRLDGIANMASEISNGNFNVHITSSNKDEISKVTDSLNLMAKQLSYSFDNLQKLNKELDQFAYVVSHDLKAPLRAINSLAEWIEDDLPVVEPDVKRNLQLMRGRVFRMENLINGILSYARIGRKELPVTTFSVESLLKEIIDSLDLQENKNIFIATDLPEITTEKLLLQQVFSNLINNGVKYNDKAEPIIKIGFKDVADYFEFYVEDNGPGIPVEFHEKIFGVFQTMEARDTIESTGIGLAIVKKIVLEKTGSVHVSSSLGMGSRFTFTWPKQHKIQPLIEQIPA